MEQSMETWLPHSFKRPKLLIVDDQPTNIRVLHELFREDCDVFMATSGEQAISVCQAQLPDLILWTWSWRVWTGMKYAVDSRLTL